MRFEWVEGFFIAQAPRPRGGPGLLEDLRAARARGVDVLVSCQTMEEATRMGLADEADAALEAGLEFIRFPIVDHALPDDLEATVALADRLAGELLAGRRVVAHCFAGIGRSGLVVVTTLIRAGLTHDDAIRRASLARGLPVPETAAQIRWVRSVPDQRS
ncbi:MAG: hypothetical protein KC933_38670 [Myxococcales bacterium]|nr:hypothetical protein [Myxococcales bacterium]MCB9646686.1 tyrosine protein phosphatase [Deltaproteobacteria bacterium]